MQQRNNHAWKYLAQRITLNVFESCNTRVYIISTLYLSQITASVFANRTVNGLYTSNRMFVAVFSFYRAIIFTEIYQHCGKYYSVHHSFVVSCIYKTVFFYTIEVRYYLTAISSDCTHKQWCSRNVIAITWK